MEDAFSRTRMLLGRAGMERLARARVAVFGLGGVGGHAVEALARSGVGALDLIDHDTVSLTNLNRQLLATHGTLGQYKVDAARDRIRDIAPDVAVRTYATFYTPQTAGEFDFSQYDYVIDAIDTVTGKLALIERARDAGVPIISAMGAGNKLDPTAFAVADLADTSVCHLARIMRKELRHRGIGHVKVVYSTEPAMEPLEPSPAPAPDQARVKPVPGSTAFVPAVAGLILAGEVVKDLAGIGQAMVPH